MELPSKQRKTCYFARGSQAIVERLGWPTMQWHGADVALRWFDIDPGRDEKVTLALYGCVLLKRGLWFGAVVQPGSQHGTKVVLTGSVAAMARAQAALEAQLAIIDLPVDEIPIDE